MERVSSLNNCYKNIDERYDIYTKKLETGSEYNLTLDQAGEEVGKIMDDARNCPSQASKETRIPLFYIKFTDNLYASLKATNPYQNSSIVK